jgi:cellulose synthase/poly-beta-1,6-N-acetylglucosamine synthase-like glycosyltransferase
MVCSANSYYRCWATALILCRMFIHIMEVCMSTGFWFSSNILKITGSHFIRPSRYRYMVCSANSSYRFRATALIFCRMFIHIMEVCMSTRFWFSSNILKITGSHFVRPSRYRYMVCSSNSYRFIATALIFCRDEQNDYLLFWEYLMKIKILWTCTPPLCV